MYTKALLPLTESFVTKNKYSLNAQCVTDSTVLHRRKEMMGFFSYLLIFKKNTDTVLLSLCA